MAVDPISLEVFKSLFISVSEEMGVALQRTAYSPNIKERRDFSCAIFDPEAQMVAQAAHVPVHLGAMPASVRAAIDAFPNALRPFRISPWSHRYTPIFLLPPRVKREAGGFPSAWLDSSPIGVTTPTWEA